MTLEQRADAAGQPADDAVLPFDGSGEIDGRTLDRDAERRERRLLDGVSERIGRMDQRLRRNAADIEAGAAEAAALAALLDQHDVEAELAGADRRDVAAGPAADDQDLGSDLGHLTPP